MSTDPVSKIVLSLVADSIVEAARKVELTPHQEALFIDALSTELQVRLGGLQAGWEAEAITRQAAEDD